jgi:hypothetical protein
MNEEKNAVYKLNSSSDILKNIRHSIREKISKINAKLVDATIIVASELCENAIKYGIDISQEEKMRMELKIENGKIIIFVKNGISDKLHMKNLVQHIDMINNAENSFDLYIETIKKLIARKNAKISQLGLIRIAAECDFKLSYVIEHGKVEIIEISAERMINK